jgi:hypothetical protein
MMLTSSTPTPLALSGFSRSAVDQALENLTQALRALELAPSATSELCPHPLAVVRAEIENARRYLGIKTLPMANKTKYKTASNRACRAR